jgi:hypothetical protein
LWELFKTLISGVLESMREVIGYGLNEIMHVIDEYAHLWFTQVLQLEPGLLRREAFDLGP